MTDNKNIANENPNCPAVGSWVCYRQNVTFCVHARGKDRSTGKITLLDEYENRYPMELCRVVGPIKSTAQDAEGLIDSAYDELVQAVWAVEAALDSLKEACPNEAAKKKLWASLSEKHRQMVKDLKIAVERLDHIDLTPF